MREAMHSRGPDGDGLWCDPTSRIALAHRRLAIIDPSERGAQPMTSRDGRLRIVFNGEIYNHPELRRRCEAHGARYASSCDTETLLHLYAQEGSEFVKRLRGMFAFALWDNHDCSLLLARDSFGIKPLYYVDGGDSLRFASQVKALLAGGADTAPNAAGIVSFYLWGYVTEPHTLYKHIKALPAGCSMILRPGSKPLVSRYNDPLDTLRGGAHTKAGADSLREAVLDSVRHHLLADVPIGLFLSAGIDSGTLCALVCECMPAELVRTVTLGFAEYEGSVNDEVPLAKEVAARYAVPHNVVKYRRKDFQDEMELLFAAMDQPTVDGVNTYFVSKAATAIGLKLAISGVGGDELFGGYPSFWQVPRLANAVHYFPRKMGRALRVAVAPILERLTSPKYAGVLEYGGSVSGAYLLRRALFMPWEIGALVGERVAAEGLESLNVTGTLDGIVQGIVTPRDQVMALEHAVYLRNCLLRDADWAGMAHSLEIRAPLVDAQLLQKIVPLNRTAAANTRADKLAWAATPVRPMPRAQINRVKTGFSMPIGSWAASDLARRTRGLRGWARVVASRFGFVSRA